MVCVHWGTKFHPEYVSKLREAVALNLDQPYRFMVLTEDPSKFPEFDCIPSPDPSVRWWWQKLFLFKPGLVPGKRILFLDLDSAIVAPLDPVANFALNPHSLLCMVPVATPGDPPASPAMLWEPHVGLSKLYEILKKRGWQSLHEEWRGGDQRFITDTLHPVQIQQFPRGWFYSVKEGAAGDFKTPISKAKVLVYHGKQHKPRDLPLGNPFRDFWECPRAYPEGPIRQGPIR